MAERGEGVVDFATPVALADQAGQGQPAGVFADGLAEAAVRSWMAKRDRQRFSWIRSRIWMRRWLAAPFRILSACRRSDVSI